MGLLDNFAAMPADDQTAWNSALMQAAQALLTPRSRGGGMGAAFGAFPQAIERGKALAQRNRVLGMQEQQLGLQGEKLGFEMDEARRQAQQDAARKAQLDQIIAGLPPDQQRLAQLDPAGFVKSLTGTQVVAPGSTVLRGGKPVFTAPEKPGEIESLIAKINSLPPGDGNRKFFQARLDKLTTHAPAANMTVHTGTLTPVEVGGQPAFAMGAKDGTAQIIPGLQPAGSAEAAAKKDQRKTAAVKTANIIIGKVDDALKKIGMTTTGVIGAALGNIPGSSAYDLRRAAETIKANLGFTQLQEMRDLSPTGGALGQVAVQELAMLQAAVSNLDPNQSAPELTKNLKEVRDRYSNVLKILEGGNGVQDDPAPSGAAKRMRFNPATGRLE